MLQHKHKLLTLISILLGSLLLVISVGASAGSESWEQELAVLLNDFVYGGTSVNLEAARRLEELGQDGAAVLVQIAQNPDYSKPIRLQAIRSLGRIGQSAVPGLVGLLNDPDSELRESVLSAIERIGQAAAASVPYLIEALADDVADVRAGAAAALGRIGAAARDALPYLAVAKADHEWSVAWAASQAINRIDRNYELNDSIPVLLSILENEQEPLYRRFAVLNLLGDLNADSPQTNELLSAAHASWASPFNQRKFELAMQGIKYWEPRYDQNLALVADSENKLHPIRESAWLAQLYFQTGTNINRANELLRSVFAAQAASGYRRGNFKWNYEDSGVEDQNAVTFILPSILYIYRYHYDQLEADLKEQIGVVLDRGHQAVLDLEHHIPVWYANVYLEMISCLVQLGDEDTALKWTNKYFDFTKKYGINEYAPWGYVGVQLAGLQGAYEYAQHPDLKQKLVELLELHWFDTAHQMHPQTLMFSPASSRAKGSSGLKVNDTARTLFYLYFNVGSAQAISQPRVELILTDYQPPEAVRKIIRDKLAGTDLEYQAKYGRVDAHVYQTAEYSLATQSGRRSSLGVINTSKTLLSSEEHETSIQLVIANGGDYQGSIFKVNDQRGDFDRHWITSVQKGSKAVVSYNFDPRGAVREQIYSYAVLGLITSIDELQINGRTWMQEDEALSSADVIALKIGNTYVGLRFLETDVIRINNHPRVSGERPILLKREGNEVVLYNYLAYDRSSMAFSEQDRRLGYVIKLAADSEFTSLSSFSDYLAGIKISQEVEGSIHQVSVEIDGDHLYLKEDLATNIILSRSVNGEEYDNRFLLKSKYVAYAQEEAVHISDKQYIPVALSDLVLMHPLLLQKGELGEALVAELPNRGSGQYAVNLGSTGLWRVWFRVRWSSEDAVGFDLRFNTDNVGFSREQITSDTIGDLHWICSNDYLLHQGTHVLTISRLAAGGEISEILITNDLDYVPGVD